VDTCSYTAVDVGRQTCPTRALDNRRQTTRHGTPRPHDCTAAQHQIGHCEIEHASQASSGRSPERERPRVHVISRCTHCEVWTCGRPSHRHVPTSHVARRTNTLPTRRCTITERNAMSRRGGSAQDSSGAHGSAWTYSIDRLEDTVSPRCLHGRIHHCLHKAALEHAATSQRLGTSSARNSK